MRCACWWLWAIWILLAIATFWTYTALVARLAIESTRPCTHAILNNLENDVYCRISCTDHGVGVRAVRPIPRGTNPFKTLGRPQRYRWIPIAALRSTHPEVRRMALDFFKSTGGAIPVAEGGLNSISIGFFMNHSDTPNVARLRRTYGSGEYVEWRTLRAVAAGEELTIDYFCDLQRRRGAGGHVRHAQ